ncbi:response regulator [Nonomuraea pusilla]|uniref:DNA-binding response regulator, NarL/FixJ family, contains REC and HTH domains n=1 Tax=Nonomuraea pusilla TaxID=46177 RepID=A0A1H8IZM2_9ACTN|nr:response regulator transcription factor [Nonomuraea pusilla]SEN73585.1 DNA-binding response regulator, NarL/FixJ family, contains REC and HTH domains [Nonomuraea pusilla]
MITVVLADDQPLIRAGLRALLHFESDIEVVGEAADGLRALELAATLKPDVVIMDVRMPEIDGIEATRRIAGNPALDDVRVIILTTFELDEYVFQGLRAGASGFLVKDTEPAVLLQAIRVVAEGDALLTPGVTRRLIDEYAAIPVDGPASPELDLLTAREREVVTLVAAGLSNQGIAERMGITQATAKTHASRAMIKLGARDRAQLVVIAYESGLVTPRRRP